MTEGGGRRPESSRRINQSGVIVMTEQIKSFRDLRAYQQMFDL